MNNNKLRRWAALSVLAALVACGGGGGDGPSGVQIPQGTRSGTASANSEINAGNASSFAGPLARAVMSAGDPKSVPGVSNGRDTPQARGERARPLRSAHTPERAARRLPSERAALQGQRWVRLALANLSSREQPLSTSTSVLRCPLGGGLTLTLIDDDNNAKLSAGDRLSIVTLACRSEPGQPASSGALALTINAIELDGNDDPTALDVTITFSGFEEEGFGTLSGSVRLWFKDDGTGGERLRLSYSAAAVTEQGDSVRYDFDITGNSGANGGGNVDLNGVFVIRDASYVMTSTTLAFNAGSNRPASGSVTLTDFLGNKLTLRVRNNDGFDLIFKPLGLPEILIPGFLWDGQLLP
jgi:hypothetical protein